MLKNLSRKLAAAAAVALLAAAAGASAHAQGNTVTGVLEVAPGERRCITHHTVAYRNASVYDFVMSGGPVTFIFLDRFSGSEFVKISDSGEYPVVAFSDYLNARPSSPPSFIPDFFPGTFRTCARNDGYAPSTVSLSITIDQ